MANEFETQKSPKAAPNKVAQDIYVMLHDLVYILAAVTVLFTLLIRLVTVSGPSMTSTLLDRDYVAVLSNVLYRDVKNGDVVVAKVPGFEDEPIVKRVIAVEGQTVDIDFDDGVVYVDGKALDEPYVNEPVHDRENFEGKITVPEGCVFVMGDNRNASTDSRDARLGCVDTRYIMGRVYFTLFPVKNIGVVK